MVREIPVSVIFTWPKPNYIDPVTRGPALIIVNAIFISLCTLVLLLRLYTRIFIKRWFGSDDVFIILAYISTVALTANVIVANVHFYWNRHVWDIPIASFPEVLKVAFSAKLIFVFAATFTRQSLLCFYYRLIADSGMKWFVWALHGTVFFNTAAAIAFTCLGIWLCAPINAYWSIAMPEGARCLDEGKVVLGIGVVNCFIDLLITILPIPIITRLQMPMQQRIGVMILLSLGFIVVIAGAIRTYYIWKGLIVSYDETWLTFPLWIAAAVEINLGVICACMPALRPFISRYIAPAFSSVSSRISSFISRTSLGNTHSSSRRASAHHARGSKSYRRFHNTTKSSGGSATLKGGGGGGGGGCSSLSSKPSSHLASSHTDATIATGGPLHGPDGLFFTAADPPPPSLTTARRLPPVPSVSPLHITCRHSFELVSLDRRCSAADPALVAGGDASSSSSAGRCDQSNGRASSTLDRLGGDGNGVEEGGGGGLELDPREYEWRAEVSCPAGRGRGHHGSGEKEEGEEGETRVGRKRSFVMGRGWGRF